MTKEAMKSPSPAPPTSASSSVPSLNLITAVALWLVVSTGVIVRWIQQQDSNDISHLRWGLVLSLLFFNNVNLFIAYCEICLGSQIAFIKANYQKLHELYGGDKKQEVQAVKAFASFPIPWNRLFDGTIYARMWSTYALFDPSYQNDESYGFFIDVGNGYSTIPPCLLMNAAMAMPQYFSPLFVGCVCLASYWQMLYGTIIYFLSYIWNRRWEGKPLAVALGFVGIANGIWFVFPAAGIYACVSILDTKDFSVFGY